MKSFLVIGMGRFGTAVAQKLTELGQEVFAIDENAESVQRQTFDYPQPVAGEGHFISTYVKNGAPIPSFAGEPLRVAIDTNDADKFADKLWASLNEDNKVSLFVRSIELETGEYEDIILNKYTAVEG